MHDTTKRQTGKLDNEMRNGIVYGDALDAAAGLGRALWIMESLEQLREKRDQILGIARRYGAQSIRVFGSRARGVADENSDVDLLVEFEPGRSLFDRANLKLDLQELLGTKVDVVTPNSIYWLIRRRILKEAVPL